MTSVAKKDMDGRSELSFESGMSRVAADSLHAGVLSDGYVGVAVCVLTARQSASLWLVVLRYEHHFSR